MDHQITRHRGAVEAVNQAFGASPRSVVLDTMIPEYMRSYWGGGSRSDFVILSRDGRAYMVPENHPAFQADRPAAMHDCLMDGFGIESISLPGDWMVVERSTYGSKVTYYIHARDAVVNRLVDDDLPAGPGLYGACPVAPSNAESCAVFSDWAQENATPACPEQWIGLRDDEIGSCYINDLTPDECLCLQFTGHLKNTYGGRTDLRYLGAVEHVTRLVRKATGAFPSGDAFPRERWESAQKSLAAKGMMNKTGSLTDKGKNARHRINGFR